MSSLQGHIRVTYQTLVSKLGEPTHQGDNYKTNAEWVLQKGSRTVHVYNWKNGPTYGGRPVKELTRWNVGGVDHNDVTYVRQLLGLK